MNIKKVYYTLQEIYGVICETPDTLPYCIKSIDKVAEDLFGGSQPTYPITITDGNIKKLWLEIYARYYKEGVICKNFGICENIPDLDNASYLLSIGAEFQEWFLKMISIISRTYNYYNTLLGAYADAQTHLMDDIKASLLDVGSCRSLRCDSKRFNCLYLLNLRFIFLRLSTILI